MPLVESIVSLLEDKLQTIENITVLQDEMDGMRLKLQKVLNDLESSLLVNEELK